MLAVFNCYCMRCVRVESFERFSMVLLLRSMIRFHCESIVAHSVTIDEATMRHESQYSIDTTLLLNADTLNGKV